MTLDLTRLSIIAMVCTLSSCQGYVPSDPEKAFELPGNYRAISDCALHDLGSGDWQMTPLETEQMVRFSAQPNGMPIHRIDVSATGEDRTKVELYLTPDADKGVGVDTVTKIFNDCSRQLTAILPLSKDPG